MSRYGERTRVSEAVSALGRKPDAGIGYGVATGGTSSSITDGGVAYTLLSFTSTGTLTVTKSGLFDYTFVGPGGAGGHNGRGGGAGGCISVGTVFLSANETITIGAGSAGDQVAHGATTFRRAGHTSIDSDIVAFCGAQGDDNGGTGIFGGGSGGNKGVTGTVGASGTDISVFLGQVATTTIRSGGGGGSSSSGAGAAGGAGGGGAGGGTSVAVAGTVNTGGGGGGQTTNIAGASGGSGIAFIRFKV